LTIAVRRADGKADGYDANHIAVVKEAGTGRDMLAFECSGCVVIVPAEDVFDIRYGSAADAAWCPWCDGPLPETATLAPRALTCDVE